MSASIYGILPVQSNLHVKQGATLQLLIAATNDDGSVFDLTGITVTSQVNCPPSPTAFAILNVATTSIAGQLFITQATNTWSPGLYLCDLKFAQGSIVLKSHTFGLVVDMAITP